MYLLGRQTGPRNEARMALTSNVGIYNNVQLGFYPRLSTLVLLVYALVLTSDWIGERLRLRVT